MLKLCSGHFIKALFACFFGLLLVQGCSTTPKNLPEAPLPSVLSQKADIPIHNMTPEHRSALYYSMLLARIAQQNQSFEIAHGNYQEAAEKTQSQHIIRQAAWLAISHNRFQDALNDSEYWLTLDPNNLEARQLAFYAALQMGNPKTAWEHFEKVTPFFPATAKKRYPSLAYDQQFEALRSENFITQSSGNTHNKPTTTLSEETFHDALALSSNPAWQLLWIAQHAQPLEDPKLPLAQSIAIKSHIYQALATIYQSHPHFTSANITHLELLHADNPEAYQQWLERIVPITETSSASTLKMHPSMQLPLAHFLYAKHSYAAAIHLSQQLNQRELTLADLQLFHRISQHHKAESANSNAQFEQEKLKALRHEIQFLLASSYFGIENYQASMTLFSALARDKFRHEVSSFYCGNAAYYSEDWIQAISCYEMVPVSEHFLTARTMTARLYAKQGQFEAALKSLRQARTVAPTEHYEELYRLEATLLNSLKRYDETLALTQEWFAFDAASEGALVHSFASLIAQHDDNQQTVAILNYIEQLHTAETQLRYWMEVVGYYLEKEHLSPAYQVLNAALKHHPKHKQLLELRTNVALFLQDWDTYIADHRTLIRIEPNNALYLNELGYALLERIDFNQPFINPLSEALSLLEKAHKLNSSNSFIQDSLGWAYFLQGKHLQRGSQQKARFEQALMLIAASYHQRPSVEVAAHYGEVLWSLGRTEQALAIWEKGFELSLVESGSNDAAYLFETLQRYPEAQKALTPTINKIKQHQQNILDAGWSSSNGL